MSPLTRRHLLQSSGLLTAGLVLPACNAGSDGADGNMPGKPLQWWDHREPLQDLHEEIFARFAKQSDGMPVEYTYQQTDKIGQALQLAKQSNQMPDVFTNVGLDIPISALIKTDWFQPLQWDEEALSRFPEGSLVEGIHTFEGEVYSFPIFTHKQYWAANFFNVELLESAGLDPDNPPATYDEFRAAARKIKKTHSDVHPWVCNLGMVPRVQEQTHYLAQAAGFHGAVGREFRTGEYAFHSEPYLTVLEFLLSLQKDGLLMPGSSSMTDKVARTRWATGAAAFYFDGPWCPGVIDQELKQFSEKLGVGPMLVPDSGTEVTAYKGPDGGAFFCSGQSEHPDVASDLLTHFCDRNYHIGLATQMAQPPLDPSVVEEAEVHPAYRRLLELYEGTTFLAPTPLARNTDVAKVELEMKPVRPGLGEIVQGAFTGDVADPVKALKQLSDETAAERERALGVARKKGAKAILDDWAFPDWQPRSDYGSEKYA